MRTEYVNTTPSARIAEHPRAVYRVTVERSGLTQLSFALGALRWRQVVEGMIERSASAAGFPLGGGLDNVTNDDTTAVVDYRAGSHPGNATVGDLVRVIEDSTPYSAVVSVKRMGPVPAESAGGGAALGATRDAEQDAARVDAEARSITTRLSAALNDAARFTVGLAALAAIAVGVYFWRKKG